MKFKLSSLILLSVLAACGKSEGIWDELSQADRDAITTRAYNECKAETNGDIADFKEASAAVYASGDWQREDGWKHTLKNTSTATATDVMINNIRVWKNDGTELFLLVTRDDTSPTDLTYFVRIPISVNEQLITDLQEDYCTKVFSMNTGSSSATAKVEYERVNASNTKDYTDTHTFNYSYPAFIGLAWNINSVVVTTDSDDKVTTEKFTSTFERVTSGLDPLLGSYTLYTGARFCDVTSPFDMTIGFDPSSCTSTDPGWSL